MNWNRVDDSTFRNTRPNNASTPKNRPNFVGSSRKLLGMLSVTIQTNCRSAHPNRTKNEQVHSFVHFCSCRHFPQIKVQATAKLPSLTYLYRFQDETGRTLSDFGTGFPAIRSLFLCFSPPPHWTGHKDHFDHLLHLPCTLSAETVKQ